jgi:hypothetical protein
MLHRNASAQHHSSLLERVPANRFALHCWALWHFRQVSSDFLHGHEIRVCRLSQFLIELVDGCYLAQPALSGFVVEVHRLYHAAVVGHVFQRRRVYDGCLAAFEAFVGDVRFAFYNLWLGAPLDWSFWLLLLHNFPPPILARTMRQFVRGDLYETLTVRVGNEVTGWEDFGLEDGL